MSRFLVLLAAGMMAASTSAQETDTNSPTKVISAGAVNLFIGETNTVIGKVVQVTVRGKVVYLNLEKPYPDTPCAGVIFASKTNLFEHLEKLEGKTVLITGKITAYHDQPQIVIDNKEQLEILEAPKPGQRK